eukprot:4190377-Prymnesium_polylepis.1
MSKLLPRARSKPVSARPALSEEEEEERGVGHRMISACVWLRGFYLGDVSAKPSYGSQLHLSAI